MEDKGYYTTNEEMLEKMLQRREEDLIREQAEQCYEKPEDILCHTGDVYSRHYGAIAPPIYQTTLFVQPTPNNHVKPHHYLYTRITNPTIELAEQKLAALEEGEDALMFCSGSAALAACILYCIREGSHIIFVETVYGPMRSFITDYLPERCGITYTMVDGTRVEDFERAIRPETALIYLESPSTAIFRMQDLEPIARMAKKRGIYTMIDNSYATPICQKPLRWGIDIVCHSASKYICGHSDTVGGAVVADREIIKEMRIRDQWILGSTIDPHQAWLTIRGMRTLNLRMKQCGDTAIKVARYLQKHPKVKQVFYPGLEDDPQYGLFQKYMTAYSGMMSFILKGTLEEQLQFIYALKVIQCGTSWGGPESLISSETLGSTEEDSRAFGLPAGVIRLSIGLENADTLTEDIENALQCITL